MKIQSKLTILGSGRVLFVLSLLVFSLYYYYLSKRAILNEYLIYCVSKNDSHGVLRALADGADANVEDRPRTRLNRDLIRRFVFWLPANKHGPSPLISATRLENPSIVNALLAHGADVTAKDDDGATPLIVACCHLSGRGTYVDSSSPNIVPIVSLRQIIKSLLDRGSDVNIVDTTGRTPLWFASYGHDLEVTQWLLRRNTNVNSADQSGDSALIEVFAMHRIDGTSYLAFPPTDLQLLDTLLHNGAQVNSKDNYGFTPLMAASQKGDLASIRLLLAHGANPNAVNAQGQTAQSLARAGGYTSIVRLLMRGTN